MSEHVLRKIHHCTFPRKISRQPFLGFYPKNVYIFSLKNSDDLFFLVIALFHDLHTLFFKSSAFLTSLLHPFTPFYAYPTCCFTRFYTLLCALVTTNTPLAIYFFLIHHCTNSLSSMHIFVHHCTFCASLHTKKI